MGRPERSTLLNSSRFEKTRRPVGRFQPLHAHLSCTARRVNELVTANRYSNVGRGVSAGPGLRLSKRIEEDQIARTQIRAFDTRPGPVQIRDSSRHRYAVLREDVPDEAAAIEAGRVRPAIPVRGAPQRQRRRGDRVGVGRQGASRLGRRLGDGTGRTGGRRERLRNGAGRGAGRCPNQRDYRNESTQTTGNNPVMRPNP